jgi:hypothetical protein
MNSKNFGYIGLVVVVVLGILIMWLDSTFSHEPPTIQLESTFLCEKSGNNKWMQINEFTVGEDIYVCGQAKSNAQDFQIQIRVYEGERGALERPIYYNNIDVSNGDLHIPLRIYLDPGNYTMEVSNGRDILSTLQIRVND